MCLTYLCSALCCASTACCNSVCCGLRKCGIPAKNFPKVTYLVNDVFFMVFSVILMYALRPAFEEYDWLECNEKSGGGFDCLGMSVIFRASFSLFMFHLLIIICLIPRVSCSQAIHDGMWTLKFLLTFAIFVATFWLPNEFFSGWANFSRIGSLFFLMF